jgi:tRNA 2-thiocytidine biosynthesis protein TtcA
MIKQMLTDWKQRHPGRIENIFRAIGHVSPSQLADRELFDFINLGAEEKWTEENLSKLQVLRG